VAFLVDKGHWTLDILWRGLFKPVMALISSSASKDAKNSTENPNIKLSHGKFAVILQGWVGS